MKHGDIIDQLNGLDHEIARLKDEQSTLITRSKKLRPLADAIVLSRQVKGVRSYLRWRQRYHQRRFLNLDDPFCLAMVRAFISGEGGGYLNDLETHRLRVNYQLLTALYQRDRLGDLNQGIKTWRNLRQLRTSHGGPAGTTARQGVTHGLPKPESA